ncbi:histidine phosphatase family protein [Sphingopyxis lindanitolerans]|uniref:Histidine phosphatase family protein n=1 Tax=Sphingopyxis lindanitolerans TaxID=2054227 RepID=A0A2S8B6K6_9SPHN|nr:histidine phosphatase family protein [Sphingopyxis lindanitolerans]PQM27978.1 histidine phosphatase family protein [Sphingopyxis lindanitolerans]
MKTLTILRHAKSGWDVQVERDFDRPINARGRRGAELIGQYVKRQAMPVDRIVASPAVRVTETLDIFQPAANLDSVEPVWDRRIYLASAATLIDVIRDTGKDAAHLLISGHNPGLEDLALMLVPEADGGDLRAAVEEKLPTSALVRLELDIADWRGLDVNMARITAFVRPRDLDPALAPAMDDD